MALAPDIGAQMDEAAPGFDARKRDLIHEMCHRSKVNEGRVIILNCQ